MGRGRGHPGSADPHVAHGVGREKGLQSVEEQGKLGPGPPGGARAVEVGGECVGQTVEGTLNRQGSLVITADHGNAEQMFNPQQDCPHTAHTTYDVFLSVIGDSFTGRRLRPGGRLADIAPTILDMLGLDTPPEMTGKSLLQ